MLPVGALRFCQAHFGRTVLPKWPFWAHLFYAVFYSISELRRACFRQAHVARAVLLPGALFRARAFALPPCAPKSQLCPLPHLGLSETCHWGQNHYQMGRSFLLTGKSFLLTVGLCCLRSVGLLSFTYFTVEIRLGLFCLRWKIGSSQSCNSGRLCCS